MNAKQVNATFDLVGYAGAIVTLHKHGGYFIGACPMCGGRDRFQIKHKTSGDVWLCRKCKPGKYNSALDFLMDFHHEKFIDALRRAGGEVTTDHEPRRGKPVTAPAPVQVLPLQVWQADAWHFVTTASDRLTDDEAGEAGRRYLLSRGIDRGVMNSELLGFAMIYDRIEKAKRPAIVIPWMDTGNVITAVKYRFIDGIARQDKARRFSMMAGSMPFLYGLQNILESDKTLLFVEGEINAISILQTHPRGVSVVSGGGEGNGNAALLEALARHYARVVIWTDEIEKGKAIRERMTRPEARLLKSPVMDGVKYDANQMLQAGLLNGFISAELKTTCEAWTIDLEVIEYMRAKVTA